VISFRIRRFSIRLLLLMLGLLFAALATTYLAVSRANEENARNHAGANLDLAAGIFDHTVRQTIDSLARSAGMMIGDFTIRQFFLSDAKPDIATLNSILLSYTKRIDAPDIVLLDDEGNLLASAKPGAANDLTPFQQLRRQAADTDEPRASGLSYLNDALHVIVVVPGYAPYPNVFAWFGLAFPLDEAFAKKLKDTTRVEATFIKADKIAAPRVLASTLPPAAAQIVAAHAAEPGSRLAPLHLLELPDDRYVTRFKGQPLVAAEPIALVLQRALRPELAAAVELENYLLLVSLVALTVATFVALWIARGLSRPVLQLAAHTRHVAAGDYTRRLELDRADELGQLAMAFNDMSAGLEERDRVRDLLDKNVSPEVAAQLLRDGATLGGEERPVTILFADLRGFTGLSEQLTPRELIALLNRYLDRMSNEIERQGGIIDKFIGDGIMALFGAPVAQADAPDRAVAAARGMERALANLNAELAREGRPPLGIGMGINTAQVVAGNMGSHRRLNYSVIGDGVNVAARVESLTRTPEYQTNIIISAATFAALRDKSFTRSLGHAVVKGRAEPVEIFAVGS
jgi:adenylate cyclase